VHAKQCGRTLETSAYPMLGGLSVQAKDTDAILDLLRPIWTSKTETASRVRQRIKAVLDHAAAVGSADRRKFRAPEEDTSTTSAGAVRTACRKARCRPWTGNRRQH
jgi:hypothetical protein